jgi:hypothetical protein
MIAYVEEMIKGVNLMPNERLALSKALVKQLKFEKGLKYGTVPDGDLNLVADARQNALRTAQDEALFTPTGRFRRDDRFEDDSFYRTSVAPRSADYEALEGQTVPSNTDSFGSFQQAPRGEGHYRGHTREDDEHRGYGRGGNHLVAFDPEARQTFGYNAGDFYPSGGREAEWFGEMRGNTVIPGGEQLPQTKVVNTSGSGSGRRKGRAEAELTMASHFDPDLGGWGIKM